MRAEYLQRIDNAVSVMSSTRKTKPLISSVDTLTVENLRVITFLLESQYASDYLPQIIEKMVKSVGQPHLTELLTELEKHYEAIRICGISPHYIGSHMVVYVVAGLLTLQDWEPDLRLTDAEKFHLMILTIAISCSHLDHLLYENTYSHGNAMMVVDDEITQFIKDHPDREDINTACALLISKKVTRMSEVKELVSGSVPRALVTGTL